MCFCKRYAWNGLARCKSHLHSLGKCPVMHHPRRTLVPLSWLPGAGFSPGKAFRSCILLVCSRNFCCWPFGIPCTKRSKVESQWNCLNSRNASGELARVPRTAVLRVVQRIAYQNQFKNFHGWNAGFETWYSYAEACSASCDDPKLSPRILFITLIERAYRNVHRQ